MNQPVAFVTGASVRIGQAITRKLHSEGYRLWIHYRNSVNPAQALADELNQIAPNSVQLLNGQLDNALDIEALLSLIKATDGPFAGRLDVLINNASAFYPTPIDSATLTQWDELINTNLRAPFLLSQGLSNTLKKHNGCIINITDIHGDKPLENHPIYSVSKAGLIALTKSLAKDLAPNIRTNAISPGAILWPEHEESNIEFHKEMMRQIPLGQLGDVANISDTVWYLIVNNYINGQVIAIDGGKSIY